MVSKGLESQSPQAGQFNSYVSNITELLQRQKCLNPLKRVNSILTIGNDSRRYRLRLWSQSPQAGQFNSYRFGSASLLEGLVRVSIPSSGSIQFLHKNIIEKIANTIYKVSIPSSGSIQFLHEQSRTTNNIHLLQVSIPSSGSIQFLRMGNFHCSPKKATRSLNPLKRVNSILTTRAPSIILK